MLLTVENTLHLLDLSQKLRSFYLEEKNDHQPKFTDPKKYYQVSSDLYLARTKLSPLSYISITSVYSPQIELERRQIL